MNTYTALPSGLIVALVGVTIILVRGTIFAPLQRRFELFHCALCAGFWVGALGGLMTSRGEWFDVVKFFLDGGTVAVAALTIDAIHAKLLGDES